MRILFITQKVDKDDDVLGVYHRWIEKLAEKFEKINVICLYRGRVELPENVKVYSLGKENGRSRLKYLFRFYKYLWYVRNDYEKVFVHMNPEYVILGAKIWKLFGKKIILWYNHPMGGLKARIAIALSNRVFHTSLFAFAARYKKAKLMPVGIDTETFRRIPGKNPIPNSLIYLGRISPIKNLDTLIDAANILCDEGVNFSLTVAGAASKPSEIEYEKRIKTKAKRLVDNRLVTFPGPVPNYKTPLIYNTHENSINLTQSGSFDKTIIEAMACGILVTTSNKSVQSVLPPACFFKENDAVDLAKKLKTLLAMPSNIKTRWAAEMRKYAVEKHSLNKLVEKIGELL